MLQNLDSVLDHYIDTFISNCSKNPRTKRQYSYMLSEYIRCASHTGVHLYSWISISEKQHTDAMKHLTESRGEKFAYQTNQLLKRFFKWLSKELFGDAERLNSFIKQSISDRLPEPVDLVDMRDSVATIHAVTMPADSVASLSIHELDISIPVVNKWYAIALEEDTDHGIPKMNKHQHILNLPVTRTSINKMVVKKTGKNPTQLRWQLLLDNVLNKG